MRWLDGITEFEKTPRDSEQQRSLVCHSPWGPKELDLTEQLNMCPLDHVFHDGSFIN